jgi:dolichol-phosphate mannosyltransferase
VYLTSLSERKGSVSSKNVSIIIPARNEKDTIAKVIDEIPKDELGGRGYNVEILVIDNGSADRTGEIARQKGARVIVELSRGKGKAIKTAFKSVSSDFIFMLDADYTYPAAYIPGMLEVLEGGEDVVMGCRLKGEMIPGAMSKTNLWGNRLLACLANILYGTRISDLCTGYWGLTSRVVNGLKLEVKGFELEAAMFAEIAKKGYRIAEVPIYYRRRTTPSNLNSVKDGLKIGWTLLTRRFQRK